MSNTSGDLYELTVPLEEGDPMTKASRKRMVLGLAIPALSLNTVNPGFNSLPRDLAVMNAAMSSWSAAGATSACR